MTENKRTVPLGLFAALYIIGVYAFVPLFFLLNRDASAHSQAEYRASAAGVCQFLFTADVIAVMVLTVKEHRFTKLTVTVLVILGILLIAALAAGAVLLIGAVG